MDNAYMHKTSFPLVVTWKVGMVVGGYRRAT